MANSNSPSNANVKRVIALKLIALRFADLAKRLNLSFNATYEALEETLDHAVVNDRLIRSFDFLYLRPNGTLFIHASMHIDWRLHAAIIENAGSDSIDFPKSAGQSFGDALAPSLSEVIWYMERRIRAEGATIFKWFVNWRESSRDDLSVRERAAAVSQRLGYGPLSSDDQVVLEQALAYREIEGKPALVSEAGIKIREFRGKK